MNQQKSVHTENFNQNYQDDFSQCGLRKRDIDKIDFDIFTHRHKKKTRFGFRLSKFLSNERDA